MKKQEVKTETFIYKVHPCALTEPVPDTLSISFNNKSYSFHFYINSRGRYVALCNASGCENFHGEGANWWLAAQSCMNKILESQKKR